VNLRGSLPRIRLYAGSLACARTDGSSVSSGGGVQTSTRCPLARPSGGSPPTSEFIHGSRRIFSSMAATQLSACLCLISIMAFTVVLFPCCELDIHIFEAFTFPHKALLLAMRARGGALRGNARGGARGHAGRAGGRESAAHAARPAPSAAPSHARRSTLSAPGQDQLLRSGVWGLCFGCELICQPKVLVVCDRWLEDYCTGSSP